MGMKLDDLLNIPGVSGTWAGPADSVEATPIDTIRVAGIDEPVEGSPYLLALACATCDDRRV